MPATGGVRVIGVFILEVKPQHENVDGVGKAVVEGGLGQTPGSLAFEGKKDSI